jgi:CRISPR-associated exonuclease Cas4
MDDALEGGEAPGQHSVAEGRLTAEYSYPGRAQRGRELILDLPEYALAARLDYFDTNNRTLYETKHSSRLKQTHFWQVWFYLLVLKLAGLEPEGAILEYPNERRRETITLTQREIIALAQQMDEIRTLAAAETPCPPLEKLPWCPKCAFQEFCFA